MVAEPLELVLRNERDEGDLSNGVCGIWYPVSRRCAGKRGRCPLICIFRDPSLDGSAGEISRERTWTLGERIEKGNGKWMDARSR